jgi:hypothetical protein
MKATSGFLNFSRWTVLIVMLSESGAFEPQDTLNLVATVNNFYHLGTCVNYFDVQKSIFAHS